MLMLMLMMRIFVNGKEITFGRKLGGGSASVGVIWNSWETFGDTLENYVM